MILEMYDVLWIASKVIAVTVMGEYIKWFNNIENQKGGTFLTCETLDKVIDISKEYMGISEQQVQIIKHCCKSILYQV